MGRLQRIESKLERAINGAFAKAFRSEVQPVEIASAVRRAMDDGATALAKGRTFVPTRYLVELSETDFERLTAYEDDLHDELVAAAQEHAATQRYQTKSDFGLRFRKDSALETGLFRIVTEDQPAHVHREGQVSDRRPRPSPAEHAAPPHAEPSRTEAPRTPAARPEAPAPAQDRRRDGTQEPDIEAYDARTTRQRGRDEDVLESVTKREPAGGPVANAPRVLSPADRPWLEVDGDRYLLIGAVTVLGRDTGANIVLDDANVSRRHSEILVTHDGPHLVARIRDLSSTNGTWVNGERVSSVRLQAGDRITIGQTSMIYRAGRR